MKGLILAGGKGTRLRPITYSTPKHLLPVYNKPLIYFALHQLRQCGIRDIGVVVNEKYLSQFMYLLGNGESFGVNLYYFIEKETLGIIHAVSLAYNLFKNTDLAVIFGDNIFEDNICNFLDRFRRQEFVVKNKKVKGTRVILKEVEDPERFGICEFDESGKIISLVEKPKKPNSNLALTGLFFVDERYYDIYKKMKPSSRGEYEYPDFLRYYLKEGTLAYDILKGKWFDTGTFDALFQAASFVKDHPRLRHDFF